MRGSERDLGRADGADGEHHHGACAEDAVHHGAVVFGEFRLDECLDRTGEAAAVETPRTALAVEEPFGHGEREGKPLFGNVLDGEHVLQILERRVAGRDDEREEGVKVAATEGVDLLFDAGVFTQEVQGAQNGAIPDRAAQDRNVRDDVALRQPAQDLLPAFISAGTEA